MGKISLNVHNQMHPQRAYSAEEQGHLFDLLKRMNPPTVLFMDNQPWAIYAKQMLPSCAVVIRYWDANDGAFHNNMSPQDFFNRYGNTPKNLVLNVLNEPSGYGDLKKLAHWCAGAMDLFGNAGISLVVPNFGEGHPDVDRLADLDELWIAFDKWNTVHYYGTHEYGTWRGIIFNEGGKFDVFPWRVGRFETFIVPYLKAHNHKIPRVILTEAGCDSAHDGTDKRGWRTIWNEQQYFDQLMLAVNKIYSQPHYVGLCLYCYGNTGKDFTESDWRSFDVSGAEGLFNLIAAQPTTPPPPNPPPTQPPVELAALKMMRADSARIAAATRRMSLELAGYADDLTKDVAMLDALLKRYE